MNNKLKLSIFGIAALAMGGCAQKSESVEATRAARAAADMSAKLTSEMLVKKVKWQAVKQDKALASRVNQMHHTLTSDMFVLDAANDGEDLLGDLPALLAKGGSTTSSVGSSLPSAGSIGDGGTLPTAPNVGTSSGIPSGPATGNSGGSLPLAPNVGSTAFSATQALEAIYGGSGSTSSSSFATAFCGVFDSLVSYILRCAGDSVTEVAKAEIQANFSVGACRTRILPLFESELASQPIPAGVVNVMNCVSRQFRSASCTNTSAMADSLEACGLDTGSTAVSESNISEGFDPPFN